MATVYQVLAPEDAIFGSAAAAEYKKINGTNYPVSGLYFDASTDESAYFKVRAARYASGLTLDIDWYADTASSGDVVWGVQIAAITPNSDTQDVETDGLATAQTVTDSHLGTTGQRVHRAPAITISNLDSLAADDWVMVRVYRDADAGGDTMTGDAILTLATLSYSDT